VSKTSPDHYKLPNGLEAYDVTQHFDFTTGNCIKYLWRAGRKGGESKLDDLRKVRWYLNQLIEREELNETGPKNETGSIVDNIHLCPPSLHCDGGWID
jgi:hypothetical protein